MMQLRISLAKLKAILLYFCNNTDTKYLGKVKLMKLFYYLDFMHLKNFGTPVTYDRYVKLNYGPIPSMIMNLIDDAADNINSSVLKDTIYFKTPKGTKMSRTLPTKKFTSKDTKYFSETELEILKQVCEKFGDKDTKFVEDVSHKEAPWKETHLLDTIPYSLAAKDKDSKVTQEEIEALLQLV